MENKLTSKLINKYIENNGKMNNYEKTKLFSYLRHIPNIKKTGKEWKIYCEMAKEKGISNLDRYSKIRPLHEK